MSELLQILSALVKFGHPTLRMDRIWSYPVSCILQVLASSCLIFASDELKFFQPWKGLWMAWWMKYQMFLPILLLQFLNLFWYFLLVRIAYRFVAQSSLHVCRFDLCLIGHWSIKVSTMTAPTMRTMKMKSIWKRINASFLNSHRILAPLRKYNIYQTCRSVQANGRYQVHYLYSSCVLLIYKTMLCGLLYGSARTEISSLSS